MKTAVVVFPGTNCEHDVVHALEALGGEAELVWHRETDLSDFDGVILPGGFAHGDYLRTGAIARFSPVMTEVDRMAGEGAPVLGICNGFQILVKTGLLPAVAGPGTTGEATLTANDSNRFEDRWVTLEVASDRTPFVRRGDRIRCPVAHAEGKFVARDPATLDRLMEDGQVVFRYVGRSGEEDPAYPANPNGSALGVAGVCDPTGRIRSPSAIRTARSMVLRSSRTLPGQSWLRMRPSAASVKLRIGRPSDVVSSSRKCWARSTTSSSRSRRAGRWTRITFSRK